MHIPHSDHHSYSPLLAVLKHFKQSDECHLHQSPQKHGTPAVPTSCPTSFHPRTMNTQSMHLVYEVCTVQMLEWTCVCTDSCSATYYTRVCVCVCEHPTLSTGMQTIPPSMPKYCMVTNSSSTQWRLSPAPKPTKARDTSSTHFLPDGKALPYAYTMLAATLMMVLTTRGSRTGR